MPQPRSSWPITFAVTFFLVGAAYRHLGKLGGGAVEVILAYTTLSAKSLAGAAKEVLRPLLAEDLPEARRKLSMVVGRDTENLDGTQVVRGTVETVAENTSDGVIAPLFYLALGGAPLAMAYKAVNTLDSMFGYKNERFLYFGRAGARLDDIANFIPARLSALLTVIASFLLNLTGGGYSWRSSLKVLIKDRLNHTSPNSGYPGGGGGGRAWRPPGRRELIFRSRIRQTVHRRAYPAADPGKDKRIACA